ncbi:MAG: hypothetical protein Q8L27_03990 [archaeon]|nr:hypothetical protein [archaeon]
MLNVKSLQEIITLEVALEGRFTINPNHINVLYRYQGIPFSYDLSPDLGLIHSESLISNIGNDYARFSKAQTFIRDDVLKKQTMLEHYLVEVWDEINPEFRDVFLAHELFEMKHREIDNFSREEAHNSAVKETDDYVKKYLTVEQIQSFNKMFVSLPKKQKNNPNPAIKIFRIMR